MDYEEAFDHLSQLDERDLLAVVGGANLSPEEHLTAALASFGASDVAEQLESEGILPRPGDIDLVGRGRQAIEKLITDGGPRLREQICSGYEKAAERELVISAAPVCGEVLGQLAGAGEPISLSVAGALLLVRYGLDKLCQDQGATA